jgi:hypothetical protein
MSYHQIQAVLDRILGNSTGGNHRAFWRGKSRDEFVSMSVFGLPLIDRNNPSNSNLVLALKGLPPFGLDVVPAPARGIIRRMPAGRPPASPSDIATIERWITAGCPEYDASIMAAHAQTVITDDTHVRYWREIDFFFLPTLSSPQTAPHVGRMHAPAYSAWRQSKIDGGAPSVWNNYKARSDVIQSFEYVRLHQRRILTDFYGADQDAILDSLWKFGADLLPRDPDSGAFPEHRMNGVPDWFFWAPYLEMSLLAADGNDLDLGLARGWQVGIVADGLIRTDAERPPASRMPIPDFNSADPNLKQAVLAQYSGMQPPDLLSSMARRAKAFFRI